MRQSPYPYKTVIFATIAAALAATSIAAPPMPDGKRLKDIVAGKYPEGNVHIGGTTGWRKLKRGSGIVLDREFSYVTPENDFKQHNIHPVPDDDLVASPGFLLETSP